MNDLIARLRAAAAIPTGLYAEAADALAAANAELAKAREQVPTIECFSKRTLAWRECGHPESCSNEKRRHYSAPVPAQPSAVPDLVRYCCCCQNVGEVAPQFISCCPDAPGSVGYVSAQFASRLAREFNAVRSPAVPEAVEILLPKGWVFYSADASIQSNDPRRPMTAMIKREIDGVQWWLQLTEEEKESTPLYSSGSGMTLTQAIQNAVAAILSATEKKVKK